MALESGWKGTLCFKPLESLERFPHLCACEAAVERRIRIHGGDFKDGGAVRQRRSRPRRRCGHRGRLVWCWRSADRTVLRSVTKKRLSNSELHKSFILFSKWIFTWASQSGSFYWKPAGWAEFSSWWRRSEQLPVEWGEPPAHWRSHSCCLITEKSTQTYKCNSKWEYILIVNMHKGFLFLLEIYMVFKL